MFLGNGLSFVCLMEMNIGIKKKTQYEEMKRMEFTLQSDSTLREDCLYLKEGDEEKAAIDKVEMEEIQRRDRKSSTKSY